MSVKNYTYIFVGLVISIIVFGFIIPALITEASDFGVIMGVAMLLSSIYLFGFCPLYFYGKCKKENKKKEKDR